MGDFMMAVKTCCQVIYTPIAGSNAQKVLQLMGDSYGLSLQWQMDEVERRLEICLPEEELPKAEEMVQMTSNVEPLLDKAKDTLRNLMEHMAKAHFQAAQAAEKCAELSQKCTSAQLMIIMTYAARPLIQMECTLKPKQGPNTLVKRRDLPEELASRVNLTLLPSLDTEALKREPVSSPTRLLARIIYY